jgi:hypothetical protein
MRRNEMKGITKGDIQDERETVLMFKNQMQGGYHGSLALFSLDGS